MADLLIKGMTLPKECNVHLIIGEDGVVSEKVGSMYHVTTEAIELPSVGRWIDGQELKAFLKRKMCDVRCVEGKMNCDVCVVSTLFRVIDKSPTLVCEEEEKQDGRTD